MSKRIDVSSFTKDSTFYGEIPLLMTVKSFDLQAIRKRYLESKKRSQRGSVTRRAVSLGGLISLTIKEGELINTKELIRTKEPRGLDFHKGVFAFSSENRVYIISDDRQIIENDWFSYIHTVDLSPHAENRLLVSSSGLDVLFEYDLASGQQMWEWYAWEHGLEEGFDPESDSPLKLTRDAQQYARWQEEGIHAKLIDSPKEQTLPTAMRAAFINSSSYDETDASTILATLFHKGKVIAINRHSGEYTDLIGGMTTPHGGKTIKDMSMATSTGTGEIHLIQSGEKVVLDFRDLPGKPTELGEMEWIQNAIPHEGYIIAIDSNRTSLVIIDLDNEQYDMIPYNLDWAVQDMVSGELSADQEGLIREIKHS